MNFVQTDNGSTYTSGGNASIAGKYLKSTFYGEDKYGFRAYMHGFFSGGEFVDNNFGYWWSSTESGYSSGRSAYLLTMGSGSDETIWGANLKDYFYNIRCLQD
jgi:uncharacterized protein (TIGR02145 family)